MDEEQRKAAVRRTFNAVAEGYGAKPMTFFHNAAACLPGIFSFRGQEHLLDVATGTGIAISALAPHLPQGKVTGVDFSQGMLAKAGARLAEFDNVSLENADMTALPFDTHSVDAANCSFGLFFVEDIPSLVRHIVSKVRPGGKLVSCSFMEGSFLPLMNVFMESLDHFGIDPPPAGWKRLSAAAQYHELYEQAGLEEIRTHEFDVGHPLDGTDAWWFSIMNAGMRGIIEEMDEQLKADFKKQHLGEVEKLQIEEGLPFNVRVIFAEGRVSRIE